MPSTEHWFKSHLREMRTSECLELLQNRQVGRICFTDVSGPMVMPVNYRMDGGKVLVAVSPFGEIARHVPDASVAFEIDEFDDYTETGWSVVVRGKAARYSHEDLPEDREDWPRPWAEGTRSLILAITPDLVTGRRLLPA